MKTKKSYISPVINLYRIKGVRLLSGSLNPGDTNPTVTVSDETLENGYFSSRRGRNAWEDEDDDY